jgi:hypothetical protein
MALSSNPSAAKKEKETESILNDMTLHIKSPLGSQELPPFSLAL